MRTGARVVVTILFSGLLYRGGGQTNPAPTADRVGFPGNYQTTFTKLLTVDRPDNGQIRAIWANQVAAQTPWWEPYPYGSVILFESWTSKRDSAGSLMLDENGRLIPDALTTLFVKRKEPGFGEAYGPNRNGEWEFIAYRPDGSVQTAPQSTGNCAVCHLQAGPPNDWTFRRRQFNGAATGVAPQSALVQYSFVPRELTVRKGTLVTWQNNDEIEHDIAIADLGIRSGIMQAGNTYSQRLDQAGEFEIRCTIHSGMRARVKVME
ncbi:MAG: cytochrome P460 family protein [Bryobacteraceae bacterium]